MLIVLLAATVWAKGKANITPDALAAKSDALYYYPAAHGLSDLAVDLVIDGLDANAATKDAVVTYYYAGDTQQRVTVTNIADSYAKLRDDIINLAAPLGQYLMPRTAAATFTGMKLRLDKVGMQLMGVNATSFYQIIGTSPDQRDGVKEYRVVLDADGLMYQIENKLKDNSVVVANIENAKTDAGWQITALTTRLTTQDGIRWKVEHLQYEKIAGFMLPIRYTLEYRDEFNKPARGMGGMTVSFRNYQLNKGAAAALFAALAEKEKVPAGAAGK
jgi:hypothetical protein